MGHYCLAPNRSVGGSCGRWLVNYDHCADHRRGVPAAADRGVDLPRPHAPTSRTLADVLDDRTEKDLRDLVAGYLGPNAARKLKRSRTLASNCQPIADAASAILVLKHHAQEAVVGMLPRGTPPYVRALTAAVTRRISGDAELEAVARGLQAIGVLSCMVLGLPPSACPCLHMLTHEVLKAGVTTTVHHLVAQAGRDLYPDTGVAA